MVTNIILDCMIALQSLDDDVMLNAPRTLTRLCFTIVTLQSYCSVSESTHCFSPSNHGSLIVARVLFSKPSPLRCANDKNWGGEKQRKGNILRYSLVNITAWNFKFHVFILEIRKSSLLISCGQSFNLWRVVPRDPGFNTYVIALEAYW